MPTLKTYDLFISHAWKYGDDYTRLVGLLDGASYFYYRNYSAPSDKPLIPYGTTVPTKEIKEAIERKIKPVNIVIVLSGMYAAYRDWMKVEIEMAQKYNKPIIGVIPWGQQNTPTDVKNTALEMVRWNTDSIVTAIRNRSI